MADNISDVLTDRDVEVLFTSFPDLRYRFPKNVSKKDIMSFMDNVARECGVENGAQRVLEYTAVAAAMKLRAKIALGELKEKDLTGFSPEFRDDIIKKAEMFKQSSKETTAVGCGLCLDIRDMDFETAIAILPLQDKLCQQFFQEKLPSKDGMNLMLREDSYKFMSLTMISGNETGSGKSLDIGEFTETIGRRLINGPVEQGDDNDIFKTFAALNLTSNALQCYASIELGKTFPEHADALEKNSGFFRKHAAETLAVCQTCREQGIKFDNVERLKYVVGSSLAKEFAYGTYAPIFDFYAEADIEKGRCPISSKKNTEVCLPQRIPETQESKNFVTALRMVANTNNFYHNRNNAFVKERA